MFLHHFPLNSQLTTFEYAVCFEVEISVTPGTALYDTQLSASLVTLGSNFLCYRVITRYGVYTSIAISGDFSQGQCLTSNCKPVLLFAVSDGPTAGNTYG